MAPGREEQPLNPDSNRFNPLAPGGTTSVTDPAYPQWEFCIRRLLYAFYMLIFVGLALQCYGWDVARTILILFVILVLFRGICTHKCQVNADGTWSCGRVIYRVLDVCFTTILLGIVTWNNVYEHRFDFSLERKCGFWSWTQNASGIQNTTEMNINEDGTPISNWTSGADSNATRVCVLNCDLLYFYPMCLLLVDIMCQIGLFTVLVLKPVYALYCICRREPIVSYLSIIFSTFHVLVTTVLIGMFIFVICSLKFEHDPILCSCLVVICMYLCFQSAFWICTLLGKGQVLLDRIFAIPGSVLVGLFISSLMLSLPSIIYMVVTYVQIFTGNMTDADDQLPFDIGGVPEGWEHLSGLILWYAIGSCAFLQTLLFSLLNLEKVSDSPFKRKVFIYACLLPFFPLFIPFLISLIVGYFMICCFFSCIGSESGLYEMPDGTIVDYVPNGYQVVNSWFF